MTHAHQLRTESLVAGYAGAVVVDDVDLDVPAGRISVIVGANACGKSTLLKTMSRLLTPESGTVILNGRRIDQIPTKELARSLGLLPQQPIAPEGIVVSELVGGTRTRSSSGPGRPRTTSPSRTPSTRPA